VRPFDPQTEDRARWLRYHAYRRLRHVEFDPQEPLEPDREVEEHARRPWHTEIKKRYAVETDHMMVGYGNVGFTAPGAPEYETNKHLAWGHASVIRPFRRQGAFRALLEQMHDDMREHEARVLNLYAGDREREGVQCLEHIGATLKQVERESRLRFTDVDWGEMQHWVDRIAGRAPGYVLEVWPDHVPEAVIEEYAPARSAMMNLMPWDDLDHGEIMITPKDLREQNERLAIDGSQHHTCVARDPDGHIVAVTDVRWRPSGPKKVDQWFTGVHPEARGKGLGKAIKAKMVQFLRDRYDPEYIGTENSQTNDAMLGINIAMGFKPHREWYAYQFEIDRIAAYLGREAASE
jgi:GNAT superfamily N-acetyltransferase